MVPSEPLPGTITAKHLAEANPIISSSVLVHRDIVRRAGRFSGSKYAQDYGYWKRCLEHTKCSFISEPLVKLDTSGLDRFGDP